MVAELAPDTVAGLRSGRAGGTGEDPRFLLRWTPLGGFNDGIGCGLVLELERQPRDRRPGGPLRHPGPLTRPSADAASQWGSRSARLRILPGPDLGSGSSRTSMRLGVL